MSAYYYLMINNTKIYPSRAVCLKLDSDGRDAIAVDYNDLPFSVDIFMKQLEVYRFFNKKVNAK